MLSPHLATMVEEYAETVDTKMAPKGGRPPEKSPGGLLPC